MNIKIIKGYLELTKPSIMYLVLVTTALGFYFAKHSFSPVWLLNITWSRIDLCWFRRIESLFRKRF